MNVILVSPSDKEIEEAIDYYNYQMYGLGDQFYQEFLQTIKYVLMAPATWRKVGTNTRRINVKWFPYLILYVYDTDKILVTCIAHQHRNPTYYSERIY